MKMNIKTALVLLAGGLTALNAHATDKALLDKLVAKGYLTQDEAAELGSDTPVFAKPKSKAVKKLTISGRLHYQYDHLTGENNGAELPAASHFYFRRLRWGAKADLGDGWSGVINLDFAGSTLSIDKAYVGYKHDDFAKFKFGYFKAPFGVEETTSSSKIKAVERSAANRFFADDLDFSSRHAGIGIEGSCESGFSYSAMVANAAQGEGSRIGGRTNTNNNLAAFGRVQFKTKIEDVKVKVGVDGGYQSSNVNGSIAAGSAAAGEMTAGTAYAQISTGGLFIQPEIFYGELDQDVGGKPDTFGYSILAAYKLGDIEPVVRYSYLDSNLVIDTDELIRRGPAGIDSGLHNEINSVFIGGNYYIKGNDIKLSAGYEWAEAKGGGVKSEIQGFRSRLQLLF